MIWVLRVLGERIKKRAGTADPDPAGRPLNSNNECPAERTMCAPGMNVEFLFRAHSCAALFLK